MELPIAPLDYRPTPDLLEGRVLLVTGAGQGLGKAIALACAAHGASLILHGRNVAKLEKTYDEIIAAKHATPAIAPLDFATALDSDFDNLAQTIANEFGRLDGIVHCAAALQRLQPLAQEKLDDWMLSLRVNLAAPFALTRACLPLLRRGNEASVIFTSESHGRHPAPYWGGFAVAKSGLEAMVNIWTEELTGSPNVRMNVVVPGAMQSPQRALTHPGEERHTLPTPEQLCPAYLYLLGPHSKAVNGRILELQQPA
jgi:NAD(P)-dependent dehydrogenase (short-subunit alcohol dehydrogenase family)